MRLRELLGSFLLLLVGCIFISGCGGAGEAPLGKWEYKGMLSDGREAVLRVEVAKGSFMRYIGYRAPLETMTHEDYQAMVTKLNASWERFPEMMVQARVDGFYGLGGETDGVLFFTYNPVTKNLISHRSDSNLLEFQQVKNFSPFRFEAYEANLKPLTVHR